MNVIKLQSGEKPTFDNIVINPIKHDLLNGDCHNAMITGKPFIGKSNMAFVMCDRIDPTFRENLDERCTFTKEQVVDAQRSKSTLPYKAVMFEEIQDGLSNRRGMTTEQIQFLIMKGADRIRSIFLSMTVPYNTWADKNIRQLSHSLSTGLTKNKSIRKAKFRFIANTFHLNPITREPIYRYPMAKVDGSIVQIRSVWVKKAPVKYWHQYTKLKLENLDRLENAAKTVKGKAVKIQVEKENKFNKKLENDERMIEEKMLEIFPNRSQFLSRSRATDAGRYSAVRIKAEYPELTQMQAIRISRKLEKIDANGWTQPQSE